MIRTTTFSEEASRELAFRISGDKTRCDWHNYVPPPAWIRPDIRDSVPPVLSLPNGGSTISPVRAVLTSIARYAELGAHVWWLWKQGFWSEAQYLDALEAHEEEWERCQFFLNNARDWERKRVQP